MQKIQSSFFFLILLGVVFGLIFIFNPQKQLSSKPLDQNQILPARENNTQFQAQEKQIIEMPPEKTQEIKPSTLLAAVKAPAEANLFLPLSLKDMSKYNLGELLIWKEPGVVECEPWGPGQGYAPCLPGTLEGDPPCPMFMDCDGDGYFWWKGEDCDENCSTCYVNSPHTTTDPDARDQDCDGVVDDLVECVPQYGSKKPFGYDSGCTWNPNTDFVLVNEGEMGKIPQDELHCKKIFGQCTNATSGFGNCTVSKTPGYFVKGEGVSCGGGIWRTKLGDSIFDCGKALRSDSYKGYYGCGGPDQCTSVPEPLSACKGCDINASFDFPKDLNGDGIIGGPWGLCHGYSTVTCQEITGCQRKIMPNNYH